MSTGLAVMFCNSMASSSGGSVCVSTSLMTMLVMGPKFGALGVWPGMEMMFVPPSGNRPMDTPVVCAPKSTRSITVVLFVSKSTMRSPLAESLKSTWSAPWARLSSASNLRWPSAAMNESAGMARLVNWLAVFVRSDRYRPLTSTGNAEGL